MTSEKPHVFVSYVRQDGPRVDWLCQQLEGAGFDVWRDVDKLWPGDQWKLKIKQAISENAMAFLPCFSLNSEARETSYQREELLLAAEQIRLRKPGQPWLFPVRFDEVSLPYYDLGANRDLNDFNRIDLLSNDSPNVGRLIVAVGRILAGMAEGGAEAPLNVPSPRVQPRLRDLLRDPTKALQVEDMVMDAANDLRNALNDPERFPLVKDGLDQTEFAKFVAQQAEAILEATRPYLAILVTGCTAGTAEQNPLWTRSIQAVSLPTELQTGQKALINLRKLPPLLALYAGAMASIDAGRYDTLKAVSVDSVVRDHNREKIPLVCAIHPQDALEGQRLAANILCAGSTDMPLTDSAIGALLSRGGWRHTPVEDWLHNTLRPLFADRVADDEDFTELFVRAEVLLGVIVADAVLTRREDGPYLWGPTAGSYSWRNQYARHGVEDALALEVERAGAEWPPLRAGLLGGDETRAQAAVARFSEIARHARFNWH